MTTRDFVGCFRRLIDLKRWDRETVVGWLEDEHHHFGLTLVHDGTVVKALKLNMPRFPWTTCPRALDPLRELVGKPLVARCSDIGTLIDMRAQCTHLFDLAGLMSAHAFHGRNHHRYRVTVSPHPMAVHPSHKGWLQAELSLDEAAVMTWDLNGKLIEGPPPYAGHSIDAGFRGWTETMGNIEAERALVLRRAVFTSFGRIKKETAPGRTADEAGLPPVCFSFQPGMREISRRTGTRRLFDAAPGEMLGLLDTQP